MLNVTQLSFSPNLLSGDYMFFLSLFYSKIRKTSPFFHNIFDIGYSCPYISVIFNLTESHLILLFLLCFGLLVGSGMRLGWQASSTNHVTTSYLWSNPSIWKWLLSWQGYEEYILICFISHLLLKFFMTSLHILCIEILGGGYGLDYPSWHRWAHSSCWSSWIFLETVALRCAWKCWYGYLSKLRELNYF